MAAVLLVFGGAVFSPSARAVAPSTYISATVEAAQGVQRDYRVPASVAMAQSILESGWGDSSLTRDHNNYFGIKCTAQVSPHQAGCVSLRTMEYYSSGATYITDGFRTYDSALHSFRDYGRLLTSLSRYANAFRYTDNPDQFIREVAQGGYATDPSYADKVIGIMRQYNLYQYNALPVQAAPVALVSTAPATTPTPTPHADPDADADADPHPDADPHGDADPHADPHADAEPGGHADPGSVGERGR